jgi:hypothetical protein
MKEEHAQLGVNELRSFAREEVQSDKVTYSDKAIPEKLREEFVLQLQTLVDRPVFGEPDWHPGSDKKVSLLFFLPSLFPLPSLRSSVSHLLLLFIGS